MNNKTEEPLLEKTPLWQRKEGQSPTGGLTKAASEEVGLGRPVTEEPSKLKKGSKAAKRRKSFCARMGGMRKRQKDSNNTGKDRLSLSLKKWNCSTDINKEGMPTMSERQIKLENARIELAERCWSGYEPTPGKKAYSKGSCQPKGSSKKKKVAEARDYLGEKVLEAFQKGMKDAARALQKKHSKENPGEPKMRNQAAVDQAARAQGDASIASAQERGESGTRQRRNTIGRSDAENIHKRGRGADLVRQRAIDTEKAETDTARNAPDNPEKMGIGGHPDKEKAFKDKVKKAANKQSKALSSKKVRRSGTGSDLDSSTIS